MIIEVKRPLLIVIPETDKIMITNGYLVAAAGREMFPALYFEGTPRFHIPI